MSAYYFRPGAKFSESFWVSFIWIFIIIADWPFSHLNMTNLMSGFFSVLLTVVVVPKLLKYLYYAVTKKPMLTVTDVYIFDHFNGLKYCWADIDFIDPYDDYLSLNLYDPRKYIRSSRNKLTRSFLKRRIGRIDTSDLKIEKGKYASFLKSLNNYSLRFKENE